MKTSHICVQAHFESPLGGITLAASQAGLAGLWFDAQAHHPGPIDAPVDPHQIHIARAAEELGWYWRGELSQFTVALDARGTAFQCAVWQALRDIEPGQLSSYGAIARQLGNPSAVRAVGGAVGRNPVSVIVPCHRVVGHDGSLTGYAGGLERKRALLALEGRQPTRSSNPDVTWSGRLTPLPLGPQTSSSSQSTPRGRDA
ncbi:MAG: hypothetical protein RIQ60_2528 [Pseudomonadota bacterium]|jgi:methylated-DNA-[protein]-cysteine S-methyltransferase